MKNFLFYGLAAFTFLVAFACHKPDDDKAASASKVSRIVIKAEGASDSIWVTYSYPTDDTVDVVVSHSTNGSYRYSLKLDARHQVEKIIEFADDLKSIESALLVSYTGTKAYVRYFEYLSSNLPDTVFTFDLDAQGYPTCVIYREDGFADGDTAYMQWQNGNLISLHNGGLDYGFGYEKSTNLLNFSKLPLFLGDDLINLVTPIYNSNGLEVCTLNGESIITTLMKDYDQDGKIIRHRFVYAFDGHTYQLRYEYD